MPISVARAAAAEASAIDWRVSDELVGYENAVAEMEARYRYAPDQQFYDTAQAIDRFISGRL